MIKKITLLIVLCCILLSNLIAQTQQNYWVVPPNKIDFTGTPTSSSLPGSPSASTYLNSNGVFDENGNILFYLQDNSVYNSSGSTIGSLANYGSYVDLQDEIAIVPVPGSCTEWYVIYSKHTGTVGVALLYSKVNVSSSGVVTFVSNGNLIETNTSNLVGIAVSRIKAGNIRNLYCVAYPSVRSFQISSSGIGSGSTVVTYSLSTFPDGLNSLNTREAEIYETVSGDYILWGSSNLNKVFVYDPNTALVNIITIPSTTHVNGVEFSPNGTKIYASVYGSSGGIYRITDYTSTATVTRLTSGRDYELSHLELARDGYIYGVNHLSTPTAGRLGRINPSTDVISASALSIEIYSTAVSGPSGAGYYRLPDQVDGENYTYNRGIGVPIITSSTINGQSNASPGWNTFYNCVAINQVVSASGSQGRIILTKVDASKNVIVGGSAFSATTSWNTIASLNADLRTFSGTSNHLNSNNGYYKLEIQVKNSCDKIESVVWWLQVNATPTPASVSFTLNDYATAGIPDAPVKTMTGLALGIYSGSYNLNNSSGTVTYHTVQIDQVDASGAYIRTILPTTTINVAGVSGLTSLALNGINIPAIPALSWGGGTGFFATKGYGNYYKLTVGVGNDCGSSTDWSYVNMNCYCRLANLAEESNGSLAYPVPFDSYLIMNVPKNESVKISIINSLGEKLYDKEFDASETSGGMVEIETINMDKGLYIYRMESNGESISGKIIK
ncbi:MAG: T9SS type A sorting domain-containing protein [Sporocytophaga sp.]|uniref:T9SS type A sorting domain-containing protein n=1 Tax=Sporocytophaga sp. TaxID=2231183 RepID=UPI001B2C0C88|nr:T9SS type A sorting domain-containing protein [Sporocytophaga sp.]MBO9703805.1 T9SS type A sorting domain-containing protein [Sporocytophaga sp.]